MAALVVALLCILSYSNALQIVSPTGVWPNDLLQSFVTTQFGPLPPPPPGISGKVVAASPATLCTAPVNAAEMNGAIVYADRGGCLFVVKVKYAQVNSSMCDVHFI